MLGKLFGWLTGADVQKNLDHVAEGIDTFTFTEQEKSEAQMKIIEAKVAAVAKQSIARRIIAVAITAEALLLLNVTVALHLMGHIDQAVFVKALLVEFMLQPFLAVVAFYFLVYIKK